MFSILGQTIRAISGEAKNVGNITTAGQLVGVIINILLGVTFALSLVGIAYSFVLYVTSAGDKDAVKKAQTSLTWSVAACVLSFLAIPLKNIFFTLIGVNTTFNPSNYEF